MREVGYRTRVQARNVPKVTEHFGPTTAGVLESLTGNPKVLHVGFSSVAAIVFFVFLVVSLKA